MTDPSARRAPSSPKRALLKIDRVVLASVVAGVILALLSSIGTEAPSAPDMPAPGAGEAGAGSFP